MKNTRDCTGRFMKGKRYSPSTEFKKGHHWRKPQLFRNKNWLYDEYTRKRRTSGDIAKDFKVTSAAIIFWLRKHRIPRRGMAQTRKVKYWGNGGEKNPMFGIRGDKHPNWHGGITLIRQENYNKFEGKRWIKAIYSRDGKKCKVCGDNKKLEVHHILPVRKYPFLIIDINNGIVLCKKCHDKTKFKEMEYAEKFLALIGDKNREEALL